MKVALTEKDLDLLWNVLDCQIVGTKEYVEDGYADADDKKRLAHLKKLFKKLYGYDWGTR